MLDVGARLGLVDGGNPHRWYNPGDVQIVIQQLVTDFQRLDPADSAYFAQQQTRFDTVALKPYDAAIAAIRAKYSGTPVGASESIFAMLAPALGLDLITPPSFLKAISEGTDVSAADKETIDNQISDHQIKIYVYNSQNVTPDVQAQLTEVKAEHIPYATITETLQPASATYQAWQTSQLARHRGGAGPAGIPMAEPRADDRSTRPTVPARARNGSTGPATSSAPTTSGARWRPAIRFEDAAVRLGGRMIWSNLNLASRRASSWPCSVPTAWGSPPSSRRCSASCRWRPAGRPFSAGRRETPAGTSATCPSAAASTPACGSGA